MRNFSDSLSRIESILGEKSKKSILPFPKFENSQCRKTIGIVYDYESVEENLPEYVNIVSQICQKLSAKEVHAKKLLCFAIYHQNQSAGFEMSSELIRSISEIGCILEIETYDVGNEVADLRH